ncbi:cupin domain-containing protein [Microbispora sp. NPDC046933]|uniref:cupin domain-containing protein n=1 Tax=Microbispora sp. NPDC046933 TaxID=3155618 RepID=UPI0033C225E8
MSDDDGRPWRTMTSVEGLPLLGGHALFRLPLRTERGLLLEIEYPEGVSSPEHFHDHDSFIYLLSGHLSGTVNGRECELLPGQTLLHPRGAPHTVAALRTSRWLEFKAPPTLPIG